MCSLKELEDLDTDALKVALGAADTLMRHKAFLPGSLFFVLLGKFRDDLRAALGMDAAELPRQGSERRTPDDLTSSELGKVSGAVAVLLQPGFVAVMDDPVLPRQLRAFQDELGKQQLERRQIRAEVIAS